VWNTVGVQFSEHNPNAKPPLIDDEQRPGTIESIVHQINGQLGTVLNEADLVVVIRALLSLVPEVTATFFGGASFYQAQMSAQQVSSLFLTKRESLVAKADAKLKATSLSAAEAERLEKELADRCNYTAQ
jgi:hypothetical protein